MEAAAPTFDTAGRFPVEDPRNASLKQLGTEVRTAGEQMEQGTSASF